MSEIDGGVYAHLKFAKDERVLVFHPANLNWQAKGEGFFSVAHSKTKY